LYNRIEDPESYLYLASLYPYGFEVNFICIFQNSI